MQVEYATDIVFKRQSELAPVYEMITRTAIHTVKPDHVATFLGRKLTGNYQDELGNDFSTRIEGTRIRHHMGPASIKMYDKFGLVLRIETTMSPFSSTTARWNNGTAPPSTSSRHSRRASTASAIRRMLAAANRRYLDFLSALDDPSAGTRVLDNISEPKIHEARRYKGFKPRSPRSSSPRTPATQRSRATCTARSRS